MTAFIVCIASLAYLGVGIGVAIVAASWLHKPKLWALILIALFWPVAAMLPIVGIILWMRGGSH